VGNLDVVHREKFGTLLGVAAGAVDVYSSHYPSADRTDLPNRQAYRSYVDGVFMGYKWQCVELARRWLYLNKGYVFDDIAMAYDIFRLRFVTVIEDNSRLPLHSFANGARRYPEPGCLLIWNEGGEFDVTGHVAVVTEVFDDRIRVIEQNVEDKLWPDGQSWSRELAVTLDGDGGYWIDCTYEDAGIMGWVIQTDDAAHAVVIEDIDAALYDLIAREVSDAGQPGDGWLDQAAPDAAAYIQSMQGCKLATDDAERFKYLCLTESANQEIKRATNELHAMFMHATNFVLQDDELLQRFNLPPAIWPRIHQSWDNRRNEMITGRFDFSLSARGLKVYEYNCDSASCHMETGKVQELWAQHYGCEDGRSAGIRLHRELVDAWKESAAGAFLHIMQDRDLEETYHAQYMKTAIEAAGIPCAIIKGISSLTWGDDGQVADSDGRHIDWVWKTWAWETALDDIRAQISEDEENLRLHKTIDRATQPPRLVDVLLRPEVMVFEPLWTLIPSNKAILPVLWMLYPDHPYLLKSSFDLDDELRATGYVAKPIVGRCGHNIAIYDTDDNLVSETTGNFEERDQIYQERFPLPKIDGKNVQVCTFTASGTYAGACVRVDADDIITVDSDILPLRIIPDPV
jgi:glutathionylspermidine amidase/synthetase